MGKVPTKKARAAWISADLGSDHDERKSEQVRKRIAHIHRANVKRIGDVRWFRCSGRTDLADYNGSFI